MDHEPLPGAYVKRTGDTMTGHLILENAVQLQGKTAAGAATNLAHMAADDQVKVGSELNSLTLSNLVLNEYTGTTKRVRSDRNHFVVRKAVDETVNNSSVLQNDDELTCVIYATRVLHVKLLVRLSFTVAEDFKYAISIPAGATVVGRKGQWVAGPVWQEQAYADGVIDTVKAAGNDILVLELLVVNGANAGSVTFLWAQNVATVIDTKVLANSYLVATQAF